MTNGNRSNKSKPKRGRRAIWMVACIAILFIGFAYGFAAHRNKWFPHDWITSVYLRFFASSSQGRWGTLPHGRANGAFTDQQWDKLSKLDALGYLPGYEPAPTDTGVIVHNPDRASAGLNFYTTGHAPQAILMDMDGRVLHTWQRDFESVWPDRSTRRGRGSLWRRAHLLDNGDVLAIFDGLGLIKIDRDSKLLWAYDGACHHDLDVTDDGRIYTLTRRDARDPRLGRIDSLLEDFVTVLDADGNVIQEVSILDAFFNSPFKPALRYLPQHEDIFHTNTVAVLDGSLESRSPAFKRGNVLLSMRNCDLLAVLDMDGRKIVWTMAGMWTTQHEPEILPNGNMLLFDNQGQYGFSKVIEFDPFAQPPVKADPFEEFDPFAQKIAWTYEGNAENGFFSKACGAAHRLPSGDTLIVQSESGRAFEVTPDKHIVWEFLNPARAGQHNELIAVIFDMVRLPTDTPPDWVSSPGTDG